LLRAWLPVVACLLVFALESTTWGGADHTSSPLRRIAESAFGFNQFAYWDQIHFMIRKTGHFMGYGIFSLVCFRAIRMIQIKPARRLSDRLTAHGLAIAATFLVAGADEFHQTFLPNRFGSFSDVLLDTSGAATLGLLLFIVTVVVDLFRHAPALAPIPSNLSAPQRREDDQAAPAHEEGPALV
jgi:VanZ family protein